MELTTINNWALLGAGLIIEVIVQHLLKTTTKIDPRLTVILRPLAAWVASPTTAGSTT